MRLIDADAPRKKLVNWLSWYTGSEAIKGIVREVVQILDDTPTIEAEPVRHGEWEWYEEERNSMFPDGDYGWRCSVCKQDLASELTLGVPGMQYVHEILDDPDKPPTLKRCLFCGAKMDGGKEE